MAEITGALVAIHTEAECMEEIMVGADVKLTHGICFV
jgi:hypothetical protein